jgi:hypothetical protein
MAAALDLAMIAEAVSVGKANNQHGLITAPKKAGSTG